jgi:hypothetical protein
VTPPSIAEFVVAGLVRDADGVPLVGVLVRAVDRDLRSEQALGEATTDAQGRYEIRYSTAAAAVAEAGTADVQVMVLHPAEPTGSPLVRSDIRFNVGPQTTIDLTLPADHRGPSEFERYLARLEPGLAGVPLADLREDDTHQDLSFLAGETGIPQQRIALLVRAAVEASHGQGSVLTKVANLPQPSIPIQAWYAWYRHGLPTDPSPVVTTPSADLVGILRVSVQQNIIPASTLKMLDRIEQALRTGQQSTTLRPAQPGQPATLGDVLALAGADETLPDEARARVADLMVGHPNDGSVVAAGIEQLGLPAPQLRGLRRGLALRAATGGDAPLMSVARRSLPALVDGCDDLPYAALAAMTQSEWTAAAAAADPGADAGTVAARGLAARKEIARLFPQDVLLAPAARRPGARDLASIIGKDAQAPWLRGLANAYRGLDLHTVLDSGDKPDDKAREIDRRLSVLATAYARNASVALLHLDYMPDGDAYRQINLTGLEADDQRRVIATFKAMARLNRLTADADTGLTLLWAGFSSNQEVARAGRTELMRRTGLSEQQVDDVWSSAIRNSEQAGFALLGMVGFVGNTYHVGWNTSKSIADYFTRIPGYAEMFGNLSYCDCSECESMLSPSAYFVDLMWFIQRKLKTAFAHRAPDYPLRLSTRRPDLWDLELTCDNTNTLIPYLDIVNDVLERHVADGLALPATQPMPVRREGVYRRLARITGSVSQPFHLHLARTQAHLAFFSRSRVEVAEVLGADAVTLTRASLGVSVTEWDLLVMPRASDTTLLVRLFGEVGRHPTAADRFEVQTLVQATGWSRASLGDLAATTFVLGAGHPAFITGRRGPDSVQNDVEWITGLTPAVLDRMHRLWRLAGATDLPLPALDLLLATVSAVVPPGTDDAGRTVALDRLLRIARRLNLPIDRACALVGAVPTVAAEPGGQPLFDRLFNLDPFADKQGHWPEQMPAVFVHPSFNPPSATSAPDNRTLQRLTAGLKVSDAELVTLLTMLGLATPDSPAVGLDVTVLTLLFRHATLARALAMPVADLGRLMRLSTVGSVNLGPLGYANRVGSLDDLEALLRAADDWRGLGISLDEAEYVIEGNDPTGKRIDIGGVGWAIVGTVDRSRPWEFADTVLSKVAGISEGDSRRILAENTVTTAAPTRLLERVADSSLLRLRAVVDPHAGLTLALPAGFSLPAGVTNDALVAVLTPFDPLTHLGEALAAALGTPVEAVGQLLRFAGPAGSPAPLTLNRASLVNAAYIADPDGVKDEIFLTGRETLLRLATLFSGAGWDTAAIREVAIDRGRATPLGLVFGTSTVELNWAAVVEARRFNVMATDTFLPDPAVESRTEPDRAALRRSLTAADWYPTAPYAAADLDTDLAAALGTDRARIAALRPHLPLRTVSKPIARLYQLRSALHLANALGISGETLGKIVPAPTTGSLDNQSDAEFDDLGQGADALYGVLHTLFPDPTDFQTRLDPIEDGIRERRRDALVSFLLHPGGTYLPLTFDSRSHIYGYFLLDTEMGGCARTSKIVAATQSLQLYMHRVLMSLEDPMWAQCPPDARDQILKEIQVEWPWRRHYRLWEANGKVFLFPWHYMEAEVRDDRTPLFDSTVDELTQQDVTDEAVGKAYTRYLGGFDELATLRVAGAFHDSAPPVPELGSPGVDQLHILAATASEPPVYYHRSVSGLWSQFEPGSTVRPVFGPWRSLDVQIPVRDVEPAVIDGRVYVFWLESATRSFNDKNGDFAGYVHRVTPQFSVVRADGRWSRADKISLLDSQNLPARTIKDRLVGYQSATVTEFLRDEDMLVDHREPVDDYTLPGPVKHLVNLDVHSADGLVRFILVPTNPAHHGVSGKGFEVDLFRREAHSVSLSDDTGSIGELMSLAGGELYKGSRWVSRNASAARYVQHPRDTASTTQTLLASLSGRPVLVRRTIPELPATIPFDLIVETAGQPLLALTVGTANHLVRLGTGLADTLSRRLYNQGVPGLLDTTFQELGAVEPDLPVTGANNLVVEAAPPTHGALDLADRPMGTYEREFWFELPYLIAGQLNANQHFDHAQRWYHHLFDPTHPGAADDADRVWRYRGFRAATIQSLRAAITNQAALDVYRLDPFNPHAIARLRPGAHQRAVVLRYIDNLIDWGDALFVEFTRESLNEALMLYVLAADILGPRPTSVGACGPADRPTLTYRLLEPSLGDTSEFLIELELAVPVNDTSGYALTSADIYNSSSARSTTNYVSATQSGGQDSRYVVDFSEMFERVTAFCLPADQDLLAYWDRVEDRLYKIRHCMDITGARREPSLFAPPIDPMMLVRARAAGLSIDDVTQPVSGSVPPYRFSFLIERAKQYAQTVQALGSGLLGALERKDTEELSRLRTTHERNLTALRTRLMEWEVTAAQDAYDALERQRDSAEYRRGYYAELVGTGLSPWERVQEVQRHVATLGTLVASQMALYASITALAPNAGSPLAMTYGGIQVSGSLRNATGFTALIASSAEAVAASAGIEAGFDRREQEWKHQQELAARDVQSLNKQLHAAQVRVDMAERSLLVQNTSTDQADDVLDLLDSKFTSVRRYTSMVSRARRVYRDSFNTALQVAQMAARAFAFERDEDSAVALGGGYWDNDQAGLGAADALLVDLQRLEQRFLETNRRTLEVEQSFSLALLAPRALVTLREKGTCTFSIPELAFDLTYPGQYRRRIKGVRVSIPCVTGPHVNVGATLRLVGSSLRRQPRLADALTEVPLRHTTAVATSSAQADPGVFEFTFRDERYLPFEGAGAISRWQLDLPGTVRAFDYRTISDVVLRIAYTAEEDHQLRLDVESATGTVAAALTQQLTTSGLPLMFSCRYDDPLAWRTLLDSAGQEVGFRISAQQLTGVLADWLQGRRATASHRPQLTLSNATVVLVTQGAAANANPGVSLHAGLGSGSTAAVTFGQNAGSTGLYEGPVSGTATLGSVTADATVKLRFDTSGSLAPTGAPTGSTQIDPAKLADIVVLVTVAASTT